ncbi:MAG: LD-carboxypeptidase [Planctomycetota bacterium]
MNMSCYLTCPAYPLCDAQMLAHAQACANDLSQALAWQLTYSPLCDVYRAPGQWLPAAQRISDLDAARNHDLLWSLRGGYGCVELLDVFQAWGDSGPALIGFSDLTVVHAMRWRQQARPGIYGLMPAVRHGERARSSLIIAASGRPWQATAGELPGTGLHPGRAEGRLFAACLRVLAGLCGTQAQPDLDGCILAIEDIDEAPYCLDRDLQQLYRAGVLAGVVGLLAGRFPCAGSAEHRGPHAVDILQAWGERLRLPVLAEVPFGHDPDPLALPMGRQTVMRVDGPHDWHVAWAAGPVVGKE